MNESSCIFEIISQTLASGNPSLTVDELCSLAGVSRSGYYAWLKAAPTREMREKQDKEDFELILRAYKKHGYSKGARGIYMTLLHMDPPVVMNLKKIRRLMKKYRLICKIRRENPRRRIAKMLKSNNVAENILKREFESYGPRAVLLTDITYLHYGGGNTAYLSTIIDAFTKQVLSYVISKSMEVDFVLETVNILIENHGISLHAETIIHSDQGAHYTSKSFIDILKDKKLRRSMSRKGNCWDNAPQESFFGHMKDMVKEAIEQCTCFDGVKTIIDKYIDYYNNYRYQWDLAKLSPNEYYRFVITGIYPLDIANKPSPPEIKKKLSELVAVRKEECNTADKGGKS